MTRERDVGVLIGKIYDAALSEESWPNVLCEIADFCGAENAALVIVDSSINYTSVTTPRADPDVVNAYTQYWWQHDPTSEIAAQIPTGTFLTLDETGREEFFASAFFNDYWRFSGLGAERISTNLIVDNNTFSNFVLQASTHQDEFDERAQTGTQLLAPHLARAVKIARKFHRLDMKSSSSVDSINEGMIVVDATGHVLFANETAEELFSQDKLFKFLNGNIQCRNTKANSELLSAVEACTQTKINRPAGAKIKLQRSHNQPAMIIEVLPYRKNISNLFGSSPAAMLLVRRDVECRQIKIEKLKQVFGLTPAEAVLAYEILKGDGRAAAAERCGITINTARTHLMRIFEKTDVRRQAELVHVLINAVN